MKMQEKFMILRAAFIVVLLEKFPKKSGLYIEDRKKRIIESNIPYQRWPLDLENDVKEQDDEIVLLSNKELTEAVNSWFASEKFELSIKDDDNPLQRLERLFREMSKLTQINLKFIQERWIEHESAELFRRKLEEYSKK